VKIKRLLTGTEVLMTVVILGLFLAWVSGGRLRYGYPFRNFFPQTCIYLPIGEVVPTLIVFLFGLGSAITCLVVLSRRSARFRRFLFGVIVALLTFCVGVYINGTS
jgi:hypothetical protein